MLPLLLIRRAQPNDEFVCQEVVKEYVMSFVGDAFLVTLFREITLQLIVLVWALMFIFLGMPIVVCLWSVPIVIVAMFVTVYTSYYTKAVDLANIRAEHSWVAEAFIPHFLRCTLKELDYEMIQPNTSDTSNLRGYRRTIIGTISAKEHHEIDYASWICRLAVAPKYSFDKIAEPLIQQVLRHGVDNGLYTVETTTVECQHDMRELLLRMGFDIRQIYHRNVVGNIKIMRSQMGIDLSKWIGMVNVDSRTC